MTTNGKLSADQMAWLGQNQQLVLSEFLRSDLRWFIAKSFSALHPGTEFLPNWHIDAIAWKLEQVRRGEIRRLIITMPPRSAKSHATSVAFPAFIHGHDASKKIIVVSYAQGLAANLHNEYRSVVSSDWYRKLFPRACIDPKKDTEQEVRLTGRGNRFATSVGGVLTGRGGDIIIIDDPLKPDEAKSETSRSKVNEWFSNTLLSRLNDKKTGAIVIVTQRLHADDLVGHVTEFDDSWEILDLPAIAYEDQVVELGSGRIHHRRPGDLLHPEREDQAVLDRMKQSIGAEAFEAQYQQRPVPPGGNIFKRDWLCSYSQQPEVSEADTVFQSWDTASKDGPENDWSVGTTWLYKDGFYYLLDVCREKLAYPYLKQRMIELAERYNPWMVLIEDAGIGTGLIEDLKIVGIDTIGIRPRVSKVERAHVITAKFQSGRVLFPTSASWLSNLEAELLAFPAGRNDDQVDSITQALAFDDLTKGDVVWV